MSDMLDFYRAFYDKLLSQVDAEAAHHMAISALHLAQRAPGGLRVLQRMAVEPDPRLAVSRWGLSFANPLGVAAGLDKNAQALSALFALGFGHVEAGTVTPEPQPGNPKPRVWRVPAAKGLINALGFPSEGSQRVLRRVGGRQQREAREASRQILGINLGKNATTPLDQAHVDYVKLVEVFFDSASYFVVNISSPNTPGLRELQLVDHLDGLLKAVVGANQRMGVERGELARPLLVKMAPDLDPEQVEQIAETAVSAGVDGIVATNTTIDRSALTAEDAARPGGLSGAPLFPRANQIIARVYRTVGQRVPIIGVGGVFSADDLLAHIRAGATLVQLYTGMVYQGPLLAGRIVADLKKAADREGWDSITELVGSAAG